MYSSGVGQHVLAPSPTVLLKTHCMVHYFLIQTILRGTKTLSFFNLSHFGMYLKYNYLISFIMEVCISAFDFTFFF